MLDAFALRRQGNEDVGRGVWAQAFSQQGRDLVVQDLVQPGQLVHELFRLLGVADRLQELRQ